MDPVTHPHVLFETMAQAENPYPQSDQARYQDIHCSVSWPEFQGAVPSGKNPCHAIRDDQQVVGATGARLCARAMD